MKKRGVSVRVGLSLLSVAVIVFAAQFAWAQSPPQIPGTVRQLTTDPADQFDPAISGNIVCYTDMRSGNENIRYYDLSTNTDHQVTSSNHRLGRSWTGHRGRRRQGLHHRRLPLRRCRRTGSPDGTGHRWFACGLAGQPER